MDRRTRIAFEQCLCDALHLTNEFGAAHLRGGSPPARAVSHVESVVDGPSIVDFGSGRTSRVQVRRHSLPRLPLRTSSRTVCAC
jgi:hypothetical protein